MKRENFRYLKIGKANDLTGKDRQLYRALEILPGFLSWGTIIGVIVLSIWAPVIAAYFIIAFDTYWLLKTAYLSLHLRYNWKRIKYNLSLDWRDMLNKLKHEHVWHLVILPFYNEGKEIIDTSIQALLNTDYDKNKMIVVLAGEDRAGKQAKEISRNIENKYGDKFGKFLTTWHPSGVKGEMAGKGSNISFASEEVRREIFNPQKIPYENVMVSAFDIDTAPYKDYFLCLTWYFLTVPNPHKVSFQPVPFYNNNIWYAPAISRVAAGSSTFWQMMQQERPEKLATFSSHSVSFKSLQEIDYWQKNMVSEDSRIFWNMFIAHNGDYEVIPISYPVSMDANLAPTLWQTAKNIYKQHRRWAWGVENVPYILFNFIKNKRIKPWLKIRASFVQIEGFWSLATNPLLIFLLGWLPVILGGNHFNQTVLSYNLPTLTRSMMVVAMFGLVLTAMVFVSFLPEKPKDVKPVSKIFMVLQWLLIPFTITIFGAIPGLEAQTRLTLGKYMGFWVTPKHRK